MFDLFDKDDSGAITMRELSELIKTSAPGSIVEQDLLALSRTAEAAHKQRQRQQRADADDRTAVEQSSTPKVRDFVFEDYLQAVRDSHDAGTLGIVEKLCKTLGMPPVTRPKTSEIRKRSVLPPATPPVGRSRPARASRY